MWRYVSILVVPKCQTDYYTIRGLVVAEQEVPFFRFFGGASGIQGMAIVMSLFISFQNDDSAKFYTENVLNTEYNLTNTKNI